MHRSDFVYLGSLDSIGEKRIRTVYTNQMSELRLYHNLLSVCVGQCVCLVIGISDDEYDSAAHTGGGDH